MGTSFPKFLFNLFNFKIEWILSTLDYFDKAEMGI